MAPITELSNPLTYYMDISSPKDIVRMMRSCDGQIFSGFAAYPSLYDKEVRKTPASTCAVARPDQALVLTGIRPKETGPDLGQRAQMTGPLALGPAFPQISRRCILRKKGATIPSASLGTGL